MLKKSIQCLCLWAIFVVFSFFVVFLTFYFTNWQKNQMQITKRETERERVCVCVSWSELIGFYLVPKDFSHWHNTNERWEMKVTSFTVEHWTLNTTVKTKWNGFYGRIEFQLNWEHNISMLCTLQELLDDFDDVVVLFYFQLKAVECSMFIRSPKRKMIAMATTMGCASDWLNGSGFNTQTHTQSTFIHLFQTLKQRPWK